MRTSRNSRETAKAASTIHPHNPVEDVIPAERIFTKHSLTVAPATRLRNPKAKDGALVEHIGVENRRPAKVDHYGSSESELSAPPSDIEDASYTSPPERPTSRKRKRGAVAPVKHETTSKTTNTTGIRQSPRKPTSEIASSTPKKVVRQPAKRVSGPNGTLATSPPANWEEVYNLTVEMRKRVLAPVDTMGCESLAEDTRSPRDRRLQTLVALMLSSQTKDTVTAFAIRNLQQNLDAERGFCLEALLDVEPARLNELIAKVGFHNNKVKYIKATALILRDRFGGDIPDTIEGLVSLPGVGPKMAYLTMSAAWGRHEGIGVDVHVHRITNLWGWHKTNTPEQTRAQLEAWLPKEKWHDINALLVGFGQTICLPVGRKCGECVLSQRGLCPSAVVAKEVKKRVKKEVKVEMAVEGVVVKEEVKDELVEEDVLADSTKVEQSAETDV
ncbi:alpha,alpha-trehalase nth1 [Elasticomyces elasticus]|nr:alpha,alpha-trehalase nth1 [Elasticomyces elasticus]